jgi:hypothetical protein
MELPLCRLPRRHGENIISFVFNNLSCVTRAIIPSFYFFVTWFVCLSAINNMKGIASRAGCRGQNPAEDKT